MIVARVLVAVSCLVCVDVALAQTADEVIERSITALGGRAAHTKITSRSSIGSITLSTPAGDIKGTLEVLNAAPNKTRTLIKADLTSLGAGELVVDQRFDGSVGYVMDSLQGNREMTGNQLDNLRNNSFPHPFLRFKDIGTSVKLSGKETLADGEAFVLVFEPTSGSTVRQFIDAETYLPIKSVATVNVPQLGQDVEQTTEFSDYREQDGIKIPFRITSSSSIQSFVVVVDKVEHNVAVDEKLFVKP